MPNAPRERFIPRPNTPSADEAPKKVSEALPTVPDASEAESEVSETPKASEASEPTKDSNSIVDRGFPFRDEALAAHQKAKEAFRQKKLIIDNSDDDKFDGGKLEYPLKEDSLRVQYYYKSLIDKATYEEIRKKVIPKQYVIDYVSKMASNIKTALAILPDRMATRLAQESDEETVHQLLLDEIMYITQNVESASDIEAMDEAMKEEVEKKPVIRGGKVSTAHKGT